MLMRMVIFAIFHSSICAGKVDVNATAAACENCIRLCCESENECDRIYANFDDFRRNLSALSGNYELAYGRPCDEMQKYSDRWSIEVRESEKLHSHNLLV